MRIVALDFGAVRTGVAVSDATGTLARPLTIAEKVETVAGFDDLLTTVREAEAEKVVVGLPVSLDGREHDQARRARAFAARLEAALELPVELYDERFTTTLAEQRGGRAPRDARAAATLLEDYLRRCHG